MQISVESRAKFMDKVSPEPMSGCWLWIGTGDDYGKFYVNLKCHQAHRVSYTIANGPIPPKQLLRHKCDTKMCVNPDHLELGDHKQNAMDYVLRYGNGRLCKTSV